MGFNDKFLNVCFKIGKVIFSFLLLIALIVTVVLWCKTGISFSEVKNTKVTYNYDVKKIVDDFYSADLGIKADDVKKDSEPEKIPQDRQKAFDIYNKFIDDNKLPASLKNDVYLPTDDKEKISYVKGLISFYDDYKKEFVNLIKIKRPNTTDEQINKILSDINTDLFKDALSEYIKAYENESATVAAEQQQLSIKQQTSLVASLISLAIFILFLFLPILIRIEENTRK